MFDKKESLSNISIVVDTYPMTPNGNDYCWRILDTQYRRVYAFGVKPTMQEAFTAATARFEEIKTIITLPRSSNIWYANLI